MYNLRDIVQRFDFKVMMQDFRHDQDLDLTLQLQPSNTVKILTLYIERLHGVRLHTSTNMVV